MSTIYTDDYATYGSVSAQMVWNDTVPPATGTGSGSEIMTVTLTPATSFVRVVVKIAGTCLSDQGVVGTIVRDGVVKDVGASLPNNTFFAMTPLGMDHIEAVTAGVSTRISVRVGPRGSGMTYYLNGHGGNRLFGGKSKCTLVVEEIDSVNFQ